MTNILKSLLFLIILFLTLSIDFQYESNMEIKIITEAEAYYGTGRRVARRTSRRTAARTTAVVSSTNNDPDVVVVEQSSQPAPTTTGTAFPVGTTVSALPAGCTSISSQGKSYFNCGGVYYQPTYNGNSLVYVVVPAP